MTSKLQVSFIAPIIMFVPFSFLISKKNGMGGGSCLRVMLSKQTAATKTEIENSSKFSIQKSFCKLTNAGAQLKHHNDLLQLSLITPYQTDEVIMKYKLFKVRLLNMKDFFLTYAYTHMHTCIHTYIHSLLFLSSIRDIYDHCFVFTVLILSFPSSAGK